MYTNNRHDRNQGPALQSILTPIGRPQSQESIPPTCVAWRAGTTNRVGVPARQARESIPGPLERFTNTGSDGGWGDQGAQNNTCNSLIGKERSLTIV